MGQPVMHFEVIGRDGGKLRSYYSELFGWEFQGVGPMDYQIVDREQNLTPDGIGIGGGVGSAMEGSVGHVTFYVGVDDAEAYLAKAVELGGERVHGPDEVPGAGILIGHLHDPEGHLIGVVQPIEQQQQ